jgi:hypothetical protein
MTIVEFVKAMGGEIKYTGTKCSSGLHDQIMVVAPNGKECLFCSIDNVNIPRFAERNQEITKTPYCYMSEWEHEFKLLGARICYITNIQYPFKIIAENNKDNQFLTTYFPNDMDRLHKHLLEYAKNNRNIKKVQNMAEDELRNLLHDANIGYHMIQTNYNDYRNTSYAFWTFNDPQNKSETGIHKEHSNLHITTMASMVRRVYEILNRYDDDNDTIRGKGEVRGKGDAE